MDFHLCIKLKAILASRNNLGTVSMHLGLSLLGLEQALHYHLNLKLDTLQQTHPAVQLA